MQLWVTFPLPYIFLHFPHLFQRACNGKIVFYFGYILSAPGGSTHTLWLTGMKCSLMNQNGELINFLLMGATPWPRVQCGRHRLASPSGFRDLVDPSQALEALTVMPMPFQSNPEGWAFVCLGMETQNFQGGAHVRILHVVFPVSLGTDERCRAPRR